MGLDALGSSLLVRAAARPRHRRAASRCAASLRQSVARRRRSAERLASTRDFCLPQDRTSVGTSYRARSRRPKPLVQSRPSRLRGPRALRRCRADDDADLSSDNGAAARERAPSFRREEQSSPAPESTDTRVSPRPFRLRTVPSTRSCQLHRVAATTQGLRNQLAVRLAGARRRRATGPCRQPRVGGHLAGGGTLRALAIDDPRAFDIRVAGPAPCSWPRCTNLRPDPRASSETPGG
jgi:hypothetical protein